MKFISTISTIVFFVLLFANSLFAQVDRKKKEEINVLSTFKPSIIKATKIEFRPESIGRDTSSYRFKYEAVKLSFSTPMSGFTIKPLAYTPKLALPDSNQVSVQLGYGNLQSPHAAVAYTSSSKNQYITLHADYFSLKGKIKDQQHAIGTTGFTYKKRMSESYQYIVGASLQKYNYRTYGFDHFSLPALSSDALKQHITTLNLHSSLANVANDEGNISVLPEIQVNYLTTNYRFSTFGTALKMPFTFKWKKNILLKSVPSIEWLNSKESGAKGEDAYLMQLPVGALAHMDRFVIDANIQPVFFNNAIQAYPNATIFYNQTGKKLTLKGGYRNKYLINSFNHIFSINPFVRPSVYAPIYQQHAFFSGMNWNNDKGLQIEVEASYVKHQNFAVYINTGFLGKDFTATFESMLKTIDLHSVVQYKWDEKLSVKASLQWISFQQQNNYEHPFGLLPFEMSAGADWRPLKKLTIGFNSLFWTGSYAKTQRSASAFRLKDAADLNLDFNYKLTGNWGLWLDLNNIANIQYQRWNQYASYGFNFRGGIKYVLGNSSRD